MGEKINQKEIARLCNVSVATVSRVLNENGRYSKETAEKVHKAIRNYGYSLNQVARGLRTSRMSAIGVVVPDITNEFFAELILALQEYLFRHEHSCIIFNTNESEKIERQCIANLVSLNVSGIVSVNSRLELNRLLPPGIPVVYVDQQEEGSLGAADRAYVSSDHEAGAYLAGKELAQCGCKTVACITALRDAAATHMRNAGFKRACLEYQVSLPQKLIFSPEVVSLQAGYEIGEKILDSGLPVDGIFCQTDWLAIGALNALLNRGIRVPEEMQLIGFDDIRASEIAKIPLTTIHQNSPEIGIRTARLMLSMIGGTVPEENRVLLPVEVVRRGTTRAVDGGQAPKGRRIG